MVNESLKKIVSFLFVLAFAVLAFASTFIILSKMDNGNDTLIAL